jgi:hypothetical protein
MMVMSGLPEGYTAEDHARDHDIFGAWLKENYPDCLFVGPCTVGDINLFNIDMDQAGGGIASVAQMLNAYDAGANIVVIGNYFERFPEHIPMFVQAKKVYGKS